MCFGNAQTSQTTNVATPNPAVASAATQNMNFVEGLQNAGFTPYTGQQVANFSPQQQASFNMTDQIANNGTAPAATSMIDQYAKAPASSVSPETIASQMSPYMNQYVMQALAPQLQQMDIQNAKTQAGTNAEATSSGAFGDARQGIENANNNFLNNVAREGLIGNAYNNAFNTAIGAGAQDVSNNLQGQTTNANLQEQALQRSLGGAQALEGLQTQQLGVAGAENTMGQQQTAQSQADLTAQYNQWLMAQQYPFQTAQLLNQSEAAGAAAMPATTTSTTTQPNNSGWSVLGALGGAALSFSDRRLKKNIHKIGEMLDGTPLHLFEYIGDSTPHIGVMAQEVKLRRPDAVKKVNGYFAVDYAKATELSRAMAEAI